MTRKVIIQAEWEQLLDGDWVLVNKHLRKRVGDVIKLKRNVANADFVFFEGAIFGKENLTSGYFEMLEEAQAWVEFQLGARLVDSSCTAKEKA